MGPGTAPDGKQSGGGAEGAARRPHIGHPWQVRETVTAPDCPAWVFDDSLTLSAGDYFAALGAARDEKMAREAEAAPAGKAAARRPAGPRLFQTSDDEPATKFKKGSAA